MKVTPFTRDLLKAYREEKAAGRLTKQDVDRAIKAVEAAPASCDVPKIGKIDVVWTDYKLHVNK